MKIIKSLLVLIAMICVTATTTYAQTNETASTTEVAAKTAVAPKTIKVKVKGVGCARDLQAISMSVAKVNGVSICETLKKGATTTFSVTFNPSVADEKEIYSAVEDTPGCSNQTARPYKVKL
ncbi:MAG: hypothetical protein AB8G86_15845 [Saprospiraceae bacterium]